MGEPATRGREREREYAQISERERLQSKFLLKFSYGKMLSLPSDLGETTRKSISKYFINFLFIFYVDIVLIFLMRRR